MERVWTVNNRMAHKPHGTQEVTQQVVHILDAKYEMADLQSVVSAYCTHRSLQDYSQCLGNFLMEH